MALAQDCDTLKAFSGGILAMTAYSAVIVALTRSPMGPVAALRETSIVMATIIGVVFLKEKLTWRRAVASLTISTGAIILASRQ
jgi:drug/metabolite transporter (DMT)-like permease